MKTYPCLIILLLLSFVNDINSQETINGTLMHDNIEREYILYVPASYDSQVETSLLFNFHGYTSNAFQQMLYGSFTSIADEEGFLIVHPEGTEDLSGTTHFNVG